MLSATNLMGLCVGAAFCVGFLFVRARAELPMPNFCSCSANAGNHVRAPCSSSEAKGSIIRLALAGLGARKPLPCARTSRKRKSCALACIRTTRRRRACSHTVLGSSLHASPRPICVKLMMVNFHTSSHRARQPKGSAWSSVPTPKRTALLLCGSSMSFSSRSQSGKSDGQSGRWLRLSSAARQQRHALLPSSAGFRLRVSRARCNTFLK